MQFQIAVHVYRYEMIDSTNRIQVIFYKVFKNKQFLPVRCVNSGETPDKEIYVYKWKK